MKFYQVAFVATFVLLIQSVNAWPVEYRLPAKVTTTVGELTTVQIDIKNSGLSAEYYQILIQATLPNEMQITNPSIITETVNPGVGISVFTGIRTLTENNNGLLVTITQDASPSNAVTPPTIPVTSKKYSLPEFGLIGFLQIIAIAAIIYYLFLSKSLKLYTH